MRNPITLEFPMFRPSQPIAVLLWLAAAAFGPAATAAIVNYNFSVEVTSGPLPPQTFDGSFAFDGAVPPTIGVGGEDLYALTGFSFDFGGASFALADLDYGDAAFVGGSFIGLDAADRLGTFLFLPANAPLPPSFTYDLGGVGQSGDGNPSFVQVPEPTGGLLAAAAVGAMLIGRRRRPTGS
jgi:hypothetical protein